MSYVTSPCLSNLPSAPAYRRWLARAKDSAVAEVHVWQPERRNTSGSTSAPTPHSRISFSTKVRVCFESRRRRSCSAGVTTRLPQCIHGPMPSCSHTIRPHCRQLLMSLCLLAMHSQKCRPGTTLEILPSFIRSIKLTYFGFGCFAVVRP